jgi:hypothetical protein
MASGDAIHRLGHRIRVELNDAEMYAGIAYRVAQDTDDPSKGDLYWVVDAIAQAQRRLRDVEEGRR